MTTSPWKFLVSSTVLLWKKDHSTSSPVVLSATGHSVTFSSQTRTQAHTLLQRSNTWLNSGYFQTKTRGKCCENIPLCRAEKNPFLSLCTITKKGFVKLTLKEKRNSLFLSVVMYWMKNIHDFLNDFISSNFVNAAFLDQIITVIKTLNYKLYSSSSKCDNQKMLQNLKHTIKKSKERLHKE